MSSKILKTLSVGILSVLLVAGCGCNKKKNEKNDPSSNSNDPVIVTNETLTTNGEVENLAYEISGVVYDGSMTTMTFKITNKAAEAQNLSIINANVTYMDGDIERNSNLAIYIGETIQPGESIVTTTSIDADLRNTTNVTYTVQR